jgi:hypothetical protein
MKEKLEYRELNAFWLEFGASNTLRNLLRFREVNINLN